VRDVSYDEDRSQVRTGQCPHVLASLRNTAISLLRLAGWDNIAKAGLTSRPRPLHHRHMATDLRKHVFSGALASNKISKCLAKVRSQRLTTASTRAYHTCYLT
jgi:hypothetical protein